MRFDPGLAGREPTLKRDAVAGVRVAGGRAAVSDAGYGASWRPTGRCGSTWPGSSQPTSKAEES